jgi:hypothetical protein
LRDILDAIAAIERHLHRGKADFERVELLQGGFVRHLQIIGEAARTLPEDVRASGAADRVAQDRRDAQRARARILRHRRRHRLGRREPRCPALKSRIEQRLQRLERQA